MNGVSKITGEGRILIPADIREALRVTPGDSLVWEMQPDGAARVCRLHPLDVERLRAVEGTLTEWATREDEEAYGEL